MLAVSGFIGVPIALADGRTASSDGAEVYIITPVDAEQVSSPVTIKFGLRGMDVAPAGTEKANTGHHHLIIDAPLPPFDEPVPADDNYRHFGGGQTEVTLDLGLGNHTLQLLLADHNHIPHEPVIRSRRIIINVK
ncbi:MAG TPA: DUF4399 domain-containing protein [Alphaproteobacteria bacterium]|jgi:hypothetical protein|nr:DUF4399 domain-containing protein [Alphaproteobacteria bacterium]HIB55683.1 DUF4399 domain-containing protein [Alphaproteobacteria bacterium]HIC73253.1 DUF4399 domain-containing protein [Alphaproteobacteria bacterium]HIM73247.1 DUF4399 domain-containing protein [Alphaproteobacteria bacterium]